MVRSVRFVRLIRGCWTSTVSWDALKWPKWRAFPKMSSSWDGVYKEMSVGKKGAFQHGCNTIPTFMRNLHDDFLPHYHLGLPRGNLFLGFVYRSTAVAHRSPVLPSFRCHGSVGFNGAEAKRPRSDLLSVDLNHRGRLARQH